MGREAESAEPSRSMASRRVPGSANVKDFMEFMPSRAVIFQPNGRNCLFGSNIEPFAARWNDKLEDNHLYWAQAKTHALGKGFEDI